MVVVSSQPFVAFVLTCSTKATKENKKGDLFILIS